MKENSAHGFTEGSEVPKEQDAAHSFEKGVDIICEECKSEKAIHYANNKYFCSGCFAKEYTRLRSELRREKDEFSSVRKSFHEMNKKLMDDLIAAKSELQQKDEVINELVEAVEKLLRVDSFRGDFPYTTKVFESVIQKSKAK